MKDMRRRRSRGFVLIIALWIVALLTILVLNLVYRTRLGMALTDYRGDDLKARALLDAGLARALWAIRQDRDVEVDHGAESWSVAPPMAAEGLVPEEFRDQPTPAVLWRVIDEGSKLNLNVVAPEVLAELLEFSYAEDAEGETLADYIKDWVDRNDRGPGEEGFYTSLDPGYVPRNDALTYLEELRAVRDVIPWLYYGEDLNMDGLLDEAEDDGTRRPPADNRDGKLQRGLRDLLTVHGDGTVNVNTVPLKTLESIFRAILDRSKASELAQAIDRSRSGPDGISGTEDDTPLRSIQEIAQLIGASVYQRCRNLGAPLGVASSAFTVFAQVRMEKEKIELRGRGLVLRDGEGARLAYWRLEA